MTKPKPNMESRKVRVRISLAIARWVDKDPLEDNASQDALVDDILEIFKEETRANDRKVKISKKDYRDIYLQYKSIIDSAWNGSKGVYILTTYKVEKIRELIVEAYEN